jgi:hypothetical protein
VKSLGYDIFKGGLTRRIPDEQTERDKSAWGWFPDSVSFGFTAQ